MMTNKDALENTDELIRWLRGDVMELMKEVVRTALTDKPAGSLDYYLKSASGFVYGGCIGRDEIRDIEGIKRFLLTEYAYPIRKALQEEV